MSPTASRLPEGHVHVFFYDADADGLDAVQWARLRGWLQPDELQRFERFKNLESRASFLIGRGLARRVLADLTGVPPEHWHFREGRNGRPEISAPATTLEFNLAHSGGMVACVVADRRDVGVDVEHLDRTRLLHDVAARTCAPDELADIDAEPDDRRQQRFLIYWTLKEAYLKARGVGISVHLADVAFSLEGGTPKIALRGSMAGEDDRWLFGLAKPSDRHLLAVAADTRDGVTPTVTLLRVMAHHFVA
jgi:4'-phosphopantetheinyl transferase